MHASPVVQAFPSSHGVPSGLSARVQLPVAGSHTGAAWHWLPMGQALGVPAQMPLLQASPSVHAFPSLHEVPSRTHASAGQVTALPVQASAMSQGPAAGRQTVPDARSLSVGQVVAAPVQFSATSQRPAAGRHTAVPGR